VDGFLWPPMAAPEAAAPTGATIGPGLILETIRQFFEVRGEDGARDNDLIAALDWKHVQCDERDGVLDLVSRTGSLLRTTLNADGSIETGRLLALAGENRAAVPPRIKAPRVVTAGILAGVDPHLVDLQTGEPDGRDGPELAAPGRNLR